MSSGYQKTSKGDFCPGVRDKALLAKLSESLQQEAIGRREGEWGGGGWYFAGVPLLERDRARGTPRTLCGARNQNNERDIASM